MPSLSDRLLRALETRVSVCASTPFKLADTMHNSYLNHVAVCQQCDRLPPQSLSFTERGECGHLPLPRTASRSAAENTRHGPGFPQLCCQLQRALQRHETNTDYTTAECWRLGILGTTVRYSVVPCTRALCARCTQKAFTQSKAIRMLRKKVTVTDHELA